MHMAYYFGKLFIHMFNVILSWYYFPNEIYEGKVWKKMTSVDV